MAVYKGREVQILGRADGVDVSPVYRVLDQWGQEEQVSLDKLGVTEDEKKNIFPDTEVSVIKSKDLTDLRDGQNVDKIKAKQDKGELISKDVTLPMPVKIVETKK